MMKFVQVLSIINFCLTFSRKSINAILLEKGLKERLIEQIISAISTQLFRYTFRQHLLKPRLHVTVRFRAQRLHPK